MKTSFFTFLDATAKSFDMAERTAHKITHDDLNMCKVCAEVVPRFINNKQRGVRIIYSRKMMGMVSSHPSVLDTTVTCDDSWINC